MFTEDEIKKIKGLKDFSKDFGAKEIERDFLEDKKDKLKNKYVGEDFVEEFKKKIDEEAVGGDFLEGKKQKLNEKEENLDNLNDIQENMEKVDTKNKINEKYYENLLNEDLQKKFNEYFNETGKYANWGIKIKKDFISEIDKKINNKVITENEKQLLKQIKQMCNDINNKQEIKNFIIDKIEKTDLSYKVILKEMEEIGLKISLANISRISVRELGKDYHKKYHNGKIKECGRCHEIKSLNEFEMKSNKTVYERYCKPCRLEYKQVRALQNKNEIIRNIYSGRFSEKCPECNTTTTKLPAFDFHHTVKELKTKRINFHGNWENTLKQLEKEKAIPSCRNCHLKKQSKYYKTYKELIENKNDFESSVKDIEKKLYELIYKRFPAKGHKEGYQIKSWISKRIVIDRLYNGMCISCGEKNLAALQFHHRDITKKTFQKYDKLRYTTIEKIEKKLIQDDAVCLCGNCHRMTEAYYFEKNHREIIGNKYSREITTFYKNLKNNIKNFKFPVNIIKQYPLIKTEKVEIGWKPNSYELTYDEERMKEEIRSSNWNGISQNWKLPTGELLNPTKESSRTNPLYKHKAWLEYVYYEWGLSDQKIARITNTSLTTINYWRNKLKIQAKKGNIRKF